MSYKYINPNPCKKLVGDCVIRALAVAENKKWQDIYIDLCMQGLKMCDMPSSNSVWRAYLTEKGYKTHSIIRECTIQDFADAHPVGVYVLCTGNHTVTVKNGCWCDTWDSGLEAPLFYMTKEIVR